MTDPTDRPARTVTLPFNWEKSGEYIFCLNVGPLFAGSVIPISDDDWRYGIGRNGKWQGRYRTRSAAMEALEQAVLAMGMQAQFLPEECCPFCEIGEIIPIPVDAPDVKATPELQRVHKAYLDNQKFSRSRDQADAARFRQALMDRFNEYQIPTQIGVTRVMQIIAEVFDSEIAKERP